MTAVDQQGELEQGEAVVLLAAVPERLADLVAGLDETRLRYRHAPAFPTLQELTAHLAEAATAVDGVFRRAYLDRQREVDLRRAIDPPGEADAEAPALELLDSFARVRRRTVDLLRGLPAEEWSAPLHDARLGEVTMLAAAAMVTRHELGHLTQVRNLIALLPEPQDLGPLSDAAG